jgi:hypothetical protein
MEDVLHKFIDKYNLRQRKNINVSAQKVYSNKKTFLNNNINTIYNRIFDRIN